MIPVIFDSSAKTFTSNGLGKLTDCLSALVTEERNGVYELILEYPITGIHYEELVEGNIIVTSHDEQKDKQPFIIYRISKPISGVVTVNAHHVSYALANVVVSPFTATSVTDAFLQISTHSLNTNPFAFWTNKASAGSIEVKVPTPVKQVLGGKDGSILDSFGGGEYKWDGYTVRLYANRGSDKGVTIRYGKNLTDITAERDTLGLYNAVIPYWTDSENTVVYGGIVVGNGVIYKISHWTEENNIQMTDENGNVFDFVDYVQQVTTMDLSSEFTDQPTVQQLENRAQTILNSNKPWIPKDNIKIDFVALWQTEEYANVAPLERVQLCDTVSVYYPELGVDVKAKVIKVVWDALLDRYDSIELGEAQSSFAQVITAETNEKIADMPNISMMEAAIKQATDLITGGLGGHIVFLYDADGKPTDMLVMDTEDINTAVHILRINVNGIGFSSDGGTTYSSAWTLNGAFVADFITAGHMSCNRIQGGTLTLGGNNNGNGVIVMYDAYGAEIGRWDNSGLSAKGDLEMYRSRSVDGVSHMAECKIGYGNMLVKNGINMNQQYSRTPSMGFILSDRSRITSSSPINYTYYKSINTSGRWAANSNQFQAETSYMTSYGVRCVLVSPMNTGIDPSLFENSGSLSNLLDYVSAYTDFTEEVAYYGQARWHVRGYGTYQGTDYSSTISADMTLGKKGHATFTDEIWLSTGSGPTLSGVKSIYCTGAYPNWRIQGQVTSGLIAVQGSSAKRYKHDITDQICEELDAHRLYDLPMKQFVFNDDFKDWQYPGMKGKTLPGFIAEDVEEVYPAAAIYDEDGQIESWDERRIIPGMLKLIQEQKELIDQQAERIANLEDRLARLEKLMGV